MRLAFVFAGLVSVSASLAAQEQAIRAQPKLDAAATQFDTVLKQALMGLKNAGSFVLEVDSTWGATDDHHGNQSGSHTRLVSAGGRYRVEVQSKNAGSPDL